MNIRIVEQAMERDDAILKCKHLGKQFVNHFDKIYNDIDMNTIKHHAKEMQGWLDDALDTKLSMNNKFLNEKHIYDWFITCGKLICDLFDNETEAEVYDDFSSHLLDFDKDVLEALKFVGLYIEEE